MHVPKQAVRLFAVLVVGNCLPFVHAAPDSARTTEPTDIRRDATVRAVEEVMPSVVNIRTESYVQVADRYDTGFFSFYGQPRVETQQALGSGVIIDEDGYLLSNLHVVKRAGGPTASRVQVKLSKEAGGEVYDVQPVFFAREDKDVALLKIIPKKKGEKFKAIKLAKDDDEYLGETVIAMGNPFGLEGSVSQGILSSKQRGMAKEGETLNIENWLQTDASINPGNSGGPLINVRGELIGLNVAIYQESKGSPVGFAIPIREVRLAITELFKPETVATNPRWFGVRISGGGARLIVASVDGSSPADKAGLKPGDIIVAFDGKKPKNFMELTKWMRDSVRDDFTLSIDRGGEQQTIKVKMIKFTDLLRQKLGMDLQEFTEELAKSFSTANLRIGRDTGLAVTRVEPGGPAEKAHLRSSQIVLQVDGQPVDSLFRLFELIAQRKSGEEIQLLVLVPEMDGNEILGYRRGVTMLKLR